MTPVRHAKEYIIIFTQVPASEKVEDWKGLIIGPSRGYISGLESVKKYEFKLTVCSSESHRTNKYKYTQSLERVIQ